MGSADRLRIAFFSPLPPAKSGIADYSAALLEPLKRLADVTVFTDQPKAIDATRYDAFLYQIGNNAFHAVKTAVRRPPLARAARECYISAMVFTHGYQ